MGLLKLIIAFVVIACIVVIIREAFKRRSKEKMVENLTDELDEINDGFVKTDLEIDVVDAKTELKAKRAVLAEKEVDLNTTATKTQDPLKAIPPKKKVAKKKAAPKKKATRKRTVKSPPVETENTEAIKKAVKTVAKKKAVKKKAAPKKKASPKKKTPGNK